MQSSFVAKKNFSYQSPETKQGCRLARLSDKDMGDFSARNQYFVVSAWLKCLWGCFFAFIYVRKNCEFVLCITDAIIHYIRTGISVLIRVFVSQKISLNVREAL